MKRRAPQGFLLLLAALLVMLQLATDASGVSWYCMRNKAHRQPIFGEDLSFVEKYNGVYIDHAHDDANEEKVVYLTFDAGYENGNVEKTLDILKQTQTTGAFFVLKHLLVSNGELVKRMVREGHTVCNHTAAHKDLSAADEKTIRAEIEELESCYAALTGAEMPRYFRPPEGKFSEKMLSTVSEMGYKTVFWSFAYADWDNARQMPPQKAMQCVMDNILNGAVILLHPTSATNVEILPRVIAELKGQGYRFGSLDELCGVF